MIYDIAELVATISESIILFVFLAVTLSYKMESPILKITGTILFCVVQCTVVY